MKILNYSITTRMGKLPKDHPLIFLDKNEVENFNSIGYSGKNLKGNKTNLLLYLNSLGKDVFQIRQTKFDTGDFIEQYMITRVIL